MVISISVKVSSLISSLPRPECSTCLGSLMAQVAIRHHQSSIRQPLLHKTLILLPLPPLLPLPLLPPPRLHPRQQCPARPLRLFPHRKSAHPMLLLLLLPREHLRAMLSRMQTLQHISWAGWCTRPTVPHKSSGSPFPYPFKYISRIPPPYIFIILVRW